MWSFKEFMEMSEIPSGFGYNQTYTNPFGKSGHQLHSNLPFMPTHNLTRRYDALMGARRRQMLDDSEVGQRYQLYLTLVRNLIADVDTGKIIAGRQSDVYKVVYTENELTHEDYPPEDRKRITNDLKIFQYQKGYNHKEVVKIIRSNDLDKIKLFRNGQLFDPQSYGLALKEGFFVDIDQIISVRNKLDKWLTAQDVIERGIQQFNLGVAPHILQGAQMDRIGSTNAMSR